MDLTLAHMDEAKQRGQPFYVNAWFHVSHAALMPTAEQLAVYNFDDTCRLAATASKQTTCSEQVFWASQTDADAQVGRLLQGLDQRGLTSNTLVVLSTDNGPEEPAVYPNGVGTTGRLRGRKRSLYDGGIRVPFIVSWKGRFGAGRFEDSVVSAVDWVRAGPAPCAVLVGGRVCRVR